MSVINAEATGAFFLHNQHDWRGPGQARKPNNILREHPVYFGLDYVCFSARHALRTLVYGAGVTCVYGMSDEVSLA